MNRLIAALVGVAIVLTACATTRSGQVIALPNGYYLQPDQSGQTELTKRSGGRVAAQPIAAYSVSGDIVTGAFGQEPQEGSHSYLNDLPYSGAPETRYFVLDTRTGRLDQGLDATAWHQRLQELGAPPDLAIYAVLPWQ
jgi:hypothetical protein